MKPALCGCCVAIVVLNCFLSSLLTNEDWNKVIRGILVKAVLISEVILPVMHHTVTKFGSSA